MTALFDLARNLFAGLRLAVFLPVQRDSFRLSPGQLPMIIVFSVGLSGLYQFAITDDSRSFNIYGVTWLAATYLALLLIVALIARIQRRVVSAVPLMIVLCSAAPAMYALDAAGRLGKTSFHWSDYALAMGLCIASSLWIAIIVFRSLRLIYRATVVRTCGLGLLYLVFSLAVATGFPQEPMWYDDDFDWDQVYNVWEAWADDDAIEDDGWAPDSNPDIEEIYYAQYDLMGETLDGLAPQRPSVTDLYFLGFGGDADDDVFMKEVQAARQLFDDRFDTPQRSLSLINNEQTVWTTPLANRHNLAQALNALGQVVDPEEDVVFLFLTSHGSPNRTLAANFDGFNLSPLYATELRNMLQEAGIKWRIIVVSACFSGGFLDILRDDYSLIITAAQRDRTSFGCGNDRDFTYFGEAYFRDQLSQSYSFIEAFRAAEAAIAMRETSEGLTPSLPQIDVGTAIKRKLRELEQRWGSQRAALPSDEH
jgi:hypothetical protein